MTVRKRMGEQGAKFVQCEVGRLYPPGTMFLRQNVGNATAENGDVYELTLNVGASHPIIRSEKTGRWWTVSWQELIGLAIKGGIDQPEEKAGGA
jgi:hypothetical protein